MDSINVNLRASVDTSQAERQIDQFANRAKNIDIKMSGLDHRSFTQPLGRITGSVDEFRKSLDAANARVIAFSASAGVLFGLTKGFKEMVEATIKVEKTLTDINVILNASTQNLEKFSAGLFEVAKKTGQSFFEVGTAATEFARQGLSMEETLLRTKDALILMRLSGIDTQTAVNSLTAAINSFSNSALTSTEIINKMANVDASFAVSSRDLAEAISRVGSSAESVNVSFDELMGAVTSVQQTTARGGSVIGNSLKTIFARIQREDVVHQLKSLGVEVRDVEGNVRPTMQVLKELAKAYEGLSPSVKAQTTELVGGVYQMNILKALLKDLGKEYSFFDKAVKTSSESSNQATKRSEELNKTLSATLNESIQTLTELGAKVGKLTLEPAIRNVLSGVNSLSKENKIIGNIGTFLGFDEKDSHEFGNRLAKGILQSLGNFISGPGLILIGGVILKLVYNFTTFLGRATKDMIGMNNSAHEQMLVQQTIQSILINNPKYVQQIIDKERTQLSIEQEISNAIKQRIIYLEQVANLSKSMASGVMASGVVGRTDRESGTVSLTTRTKSHGHIPREQQERMGALQAGYKPGTVKQMNIPGEGRVTYNTAEKVKQFPFFEQPAIMPPLESEAGKIYKKQFNEAHGFNPYMSKGFIPNFKQPPPTPIQAAHLRQLNLRGQTGFLTRDAYFKNNVNPIDMNDSMEGIAFDTEERVKLFNYLNSKNINSSQIDLNDGNRGVDINFKGSTAADEIRNFYKNERHILSSPFSEIVEAVEFKLNSTKDSKKSAKKQAEKSLTSGKTAMISRKREGVEQGGAFFVRAVHGGFVPNFATRSFQGGTISGRQSSLVADKGLDTYSGFSFNLLQIPRSKLKMEQLYDKDLEDFETGKTNAFEKRAKSKLTEDQIEQFKSNLKSNRKEVPSLLNGKGVPLKRQESGVKSSILGESFEKMGLRALRKKLNNNNIQRSPETNSRMDYVLNGKPIGEAKFGRIDEDNLLSKLIEVEFEKDYLNGKDDTIRFGDPKYWLVTPSAASGFTPNFVPQGNVFDFDGTLGVVPNYPVKTPDGKTRNIVHEDTYHGWSASMMLPTPLAGRVKARKEPITVLTARGPDSIPFIEEWLRKQGIPFQEVIATGHGNYPKGIAGTPSKKAHELNRINAGGRKFYEDDKRNLDAAPAGIIRRHVDFGNMGIGQLASGFIPNFWGSDFQRRRGDAEKERLANAEFRGEYANYSPAMKAQYHRQEYEEKVLRHRAELKRLEESQIENKKKYEEYLKREREKNLREKTPEQRAKDRAWQEKMGYPVTNASGFIPNFSSHVQKALDTERALGGDPVLDYDKRVGTFVRDGRTQRNFSDVLRDHPEGLQKAIKNSKKIQDKTASKGFIPNFEPTTNFDMGVIITALSGAALSLFLASKEFREAGSKITEASNSLKEASKTSRAQNKDLKTAKGEVSSASTALDSARQSGNLNAAELQEQKAQKAKSRADTFVQRRQARLEQSQDALSLTNDPAKAAKLQQEIDIQQKKLDLARRRQEERGASLTTAQQSVSTEKASITTLENNLTTAQAKQEAAQQAATKAKQQKKDSKAQLAKMQKEANSQKASAASMAALAVIPAVEGISKSLSQDEKTQAKIGVGMSGLQGAASGAMLGAQFGGPWGAAIGGAIGGLTSLTTAAFGLEKKLKDIDRLKEDEKIKKQIDEAQKGEAGRQGYISAQDNLKSLITNRADSKEILKAEKALLKAGRVKGALLSEEDSEKITLKAKEASDKNEIKKIAEDLKDKSSEDKNKSIDEMVKLFTGNQKNFDIEGLKSAKSLESLIKTMGDFNADLSSLTEDEKQLLRRRLTAEAVQTAEDEKRNKQIIELQKMEAILTADSIKKQNSLNDQINETNILLKTQRDNYIEITRQIRKIETSKKDFKIDFQLEELKLAENLTSPFMTKDQLQKQKYDVDQLQINNEERKKYVEVLSAGSDKVVDVLNNSLTKMFEQQTKFTLKPYEDPNKTVDLKEKEQQQKIGTLYKELQDILQPLIEKGGSAEGFERNTKEAIEKLQQKMESPDTDPTVRREINNLIQALKHNTQTTILNLASARQEAEQKRMLLDLNEKYAKAVLELNQRLEFLGGAADFATKGLGSMSGKSNEVWKIFEQRIQNTSYETKFPHKESPFSRNEVIEKGRTAFSIGDFVTKNFGEGFLEKDSDLKNMAIEGRAEDLKKTIEFILQAFGDQLSDATKKKLLGTDVHGVAQTQINAALKTGEVPGDIKNIKEKIAILHTSIAGAIKTENASLLLSNSQAFQGAIDGLASSQVFHNMNIINNNLNGTLQELNGLLREQEKEKLIQKETTRLFEEDKLKPENLKRTEEQRKIEARANVAAQNPRLFKREEIGEMRRELYGLTIPTALNDPEPIKGGTLGGLSDRQISIISESLEGDILDLNDKIREADQKFEQGQTVTSTKNIGGTDYIPGYSKRPATREEIINLDAERVRSIMAATKAQEKLYKIIAIAQERGELSPDQLQLIAESLGKNPKGAYVNSDKDPLNAALKYVKDPSGSLRQQQADRNKALKESGESQAKVRNFIAVQGLVEGSLSAAEANIGVFQGQEQAKRDQLQKTGQAQVEASEKARRDADAARQALANAAKPPAPQQIAKSEAEQGRDAILKEMLERKMGNGYSDFGDPKYAYLPDEELTKQLNEYIKTIAISNYIEVEKQRLLKSQNDLLEQARREGISGQDRDKFIEEAGKKGTELRDLQDRAARGKIVLPVPQNLPPKIPLTEPKPAPLYTDTIISNYQNIIKGLSSLQHLESIADSLKKASDELSKEFKAGQDPLSYGNESFFKNLEKFLDEKFNRELKFNRQIQNTVESTEAEIKLRIAKRTTPELGDRTPVFEAERNVFKTNLNSLISGKMDPKDMAEILTLERERQKLLEEKEKLQKEAEKTGGTFQPELIDFAIDQKQKEIDKKYETAKVVDGLEKDYKEGKGGGMSFEDFVRSNPQYLSNVAADFKSRQDERANLPIKNLKDSSLEQFRTGKFDSVSLARGQARIQELEGYYDKNGEELQELTLLYTRQAEATIKETNARLQNYEALKKSTEGLGLGFNQKRMQGLEGAYNELRGMSTEELNRKYESNSGTSEEEHIRTFRQKYFAIEKELMEGRLAQARKEYELDSKSDYLTPSQKAASAAKVAEAAIVEGSFEVKDALNVVFESWKYGIKDMQRDLTGALVQIADQFRSGVSNAIFEFIKGTKDLKTSFKELFASIADMALKSAIDMGVKSVFSAIIGGSGGGLVSQNGIQRFARGGMVTGGSGTKDDVPALLNRGEYVVRRSSVEKYGPELFEKLNAKKYTAGGGVKDPQAGLESLLETAQNKKESFANFNLRNAFVYDDDKYPTIAGSKYEIDPLLSRRSLMNKDNKRNEIRNKKKETLDSYIQSREEELKEWREDVKRFKKENKSRLLKTMMALGVAGIGSQIFGGGAINTKNNVFQKVKGRFSKESSGGIMTGQDNIPALLMGGEYVINKDAVNKYGINTFNRLNKGIMDVPRFADGGYVGNGSGSSVGTNNSTGEIVNNISINVNITNEKTSTDASSSGVDESQARGLSEMIKNQVVQTIIQQKRQGGILYDKNVSGT